MLFIDKNLATQTKDWVFFNVYEGISYNSSKTIKYFKLNFDLLT